MLVALVIVSAPVVAMLVVLVVLVLLVLVATVVIPLAATVIADSCRDSLSLRLGGGRFINIFADHTACTTTDRGTRNRALTILLRDCRTRCAAGGATNNGTFTAFAFGAYSAANSTTHAATNDSACFTTDFFANGSTSGRTEGSTNGRLEVVIRLNQQRGKHRDHEQALNKTITHQILL